MSSSKSWLTHPINGFLLDISGVLKNGESPIDGSIDAVQELNSMSIPYRLLTNETQLSKRLIFNQLISMGFTIPSPSVILSPAPALAKHLEQNGLRPQFLVHEEVLEDFAQVDESNPNCLVIGDAVDGFCYQNMNTAFRFLMDDPARTFFTMGKGKYYQEGDQLKLDLGAFVHGLEYATDRTAILFGKPSPLYFASALEEMGIGNKNVIMIGDDIVGDIGGALAAGLRGVLVKTGKYRHGDEKNHGIRPDAVVDNLGDAIRQFSQQFRP